MYNINHRILLNWSIQSFSIEDVLNHFKINFFSKIYYYKKNVGIFIISCVKDFKILFLELLNH
jgi:hypothetical protein